MLYLDSFRLTIQVLKLFFPFPSFSCSINIFFSLIFVDRYRDMSFRLKTDPRINAQWWEVKELADDVRDKIKLNQIPYSDPKSITVYTFSERNIPEMLQYLSKRG